MNLPLLTLIALGIGGTYFGFKKKDPTMKLSSCFFDKLAVPFYTLMNQYHSNSGLLIDEIGEDYVVINTPYKKLYGFEVVGTETLHRFVDKETISQLFRDFKKQYNAFFYYILHRDRKYQKQSIFSHNPIMLKILASNYNQQLLTGNELINVIYDLYLQNSYSVSNKQINRVLSLDSSNNIEEPSFMGFKRLARQALYNSMFELDLMQGYKTLDISKTNIQNIFRTDFVGTLWFYIDLCQHRVENHISKIINESKLAGNKEPFVELKNIYSGGETNLAVVNHIAFLKEYKEEQLGVLSTAVKTATLPRELSRNELIKKLPLKARDSSFDFLVKEDFLENFIASVHKRNAKKPDIFGIDKNKGFVNFSFSEENDNPHSVIIAKPGSGKSVSKQKMMSQMIGLDFSTGLANNLGKEPGNVRIRSYDIGFSDENFINLIKSNPENKVAHIESTLSDFTYNLVNFKEPKAGSVDEKVAFEADKQFSADLISIILDTQNGEPLTIDEAAMFKRSVNVIYESKEFRRYRISEIEESHNDIYRDLTENLGYEDSDFLIDIKEEKYEFLRKPLISDIVNYATRQSENRQIKEEERNAYNGLALKLGSIDNLGIFSTFDKVDIEDADVISMDLNNFKESSLFVPIFFCIFQKTYLKDREFGLQCKRNKRPLPKLFYAIEEAKNFFRDNKIFEQMFDKVTLEARKYNVHLCFVVQNAEHIPANILKNIDTRVFLLRPDKKLEVIQEAQNAFNIPDNVKEGLANTEMHELCIWYSNGVFNMKFEITPEEMAVFSTNPNEI